MIGPRSDWYRNVTADPAIRVSVCRERLVPGVARPLDRDRASVVPADYSRRHPLAWRMLTPLLGGRGRRVSAVRLAEQVPLVELDIRVPVRSRRRAVWVSNLTKPLRNLLTR